METRANYIAIGIFTLLAFAMAFGFIYWLVRYNETGEARLVELIIPGNAGGLKRGNGVLFNGLRVGSVVSVELSQSDPANVYAILKINSKTPLREDTNVTIASQPLTGLANVALVGGSADKDLLLQRETIPPLTAKQSSLNDTLEAAGKTVQLANEMLARVDSLIQANSRSINKTVSNVEAFSTAIASNSDNIEMFLQNVGKASSSIGTLSVTLDQVSQNVNTIVTAIEPERIKSTLANVDKITGDLARNSGEIDSILSDAKKAVSNLSGITTGLNTTVATINGAQLAQTLTNVETFSGNLNETLKKVDGLVGALDQERINKVVASVEGFTSRLDKTGVEIDSIIANAKTATENVTDFTKTLSDNKGNFNKIIKDASVISERLIKTSEAVTKLVGQVEGLVDADGRGFVLEATDAAKSIRRIAESFEARANAISTGLERFSTRGLGDIEALIAQSRQAVTRLEGVVQNFENNPSQFLLGGKNVPEYRRQRR